jgi:hypothetical protein
MASRAAATRVVAAAAGLYLVYAVSPVRTRTDSVWSIPIALSVLHEGNLDLDEYREGTQALPHGIEAVGGKVYSTFPIGNSLVAVPFVAAADLFAAVPWPVPALARAAERWHAASFELGRIRLGFFDTTELLVASFSAVLAVLAFWWLLGAVASARTALFLAVVLALGSPLYSTATRALWQHGPAAMCLLGAVAVAVRWRDVAPARFLVVGALGAAAFICRPTTQVPLAALLVFVAVYRSWRHAAWLLAGAALALTPWVLSNEAIWGTALGPYYRLGRLDADWPRFAEALAGNLVSPGRGVLVFVPVLALLPFALRAAWRAGGERRALTLGALGVVLVHWVAVSRFPHWWAGHAFGPRLFTEVAALALLPLGPWLDEVLARPGWRRAVAVGLAGVCVFIHAHGSLSPAPWRWNLDPVDVDRAPERLWDWTDLQFLRH